MSELNGLDIFLIVLSSAVAIITIMVAVLLLYLMFLIYRIVKVAKQAQRATEILTTDLAELSRDIKANGFSLSRIIKFILGMKSKLPKRTRKIK